MFAKIFFKYLFFIALINPFNVQARSLEDIKKSGKIKIAFDASDLSTINYPLAYEFAKYMDLQVEEVIIDWDEVFSYNGVIQDDIETNPDYHYTPDALKKADIICSTFSVLEWRKKLFDFAETLISAEILVIPAHAKTPEGLEGMKGMKIAVMDGTSYVTHLNMINQKIGGGITLIKVPDSEASKKLLLDGKVDGVVLDADEALAFRKQNSQRTQLGFPISKLSKSAWAVQKGNPLGKEVEAFFKAIENNGVLDQIFKKKFGEKYSVFVEGIDPHTPLEPVHRDLDEILKSKKIIVALRDRDFVYHKGTEKQFMQALAEEFADYLGVKMEFVLIPVFSKYWEDNHRKIVKDSSYTPEIFHYFDVACDLIAPMYWREKKVNLIPVYQTKYAVLARKETPIHSIADLKKYKGVTGKATIYEDLLQKNGVDSFYYANVSRFIPDVVDKKADYTINYNAFLYPQLEAKVSLGSMDVCWALRKDQPQLQKVIKKFISDSHKNGLLNALNKVQEGKSFLSPKEFIKNYYEKFQAGYLPYILYGVEDGLPQEDVSSILQDQKGYMWFGTNSGVVRYNGRSMEVFDVKKGLSDNSISDIKEDKDGTIYFSTTKGISVFKNDSVQANYFPNISFNSIFIDRQNNKWFLSNEGVFMLDNTGNQKIISNETPQLPKNVNGIAQDSAGLRTYLATNVGLYLLKKSSPSRKLISDHCYTVFVDATNHVWYSTPNGLFHAEVTKIDKGHHGPPLNNLFKIPFSVIKKISQSRSGSIWLMNDSHLYQVVSMDQEARIFESGTDLMNNTVLSYCEDREENLWIGFSGGLQRIINDKNLRNFYPEILNNYICSVIQDEAGRIWIGTNNGVYYFKKEIVNFSSHLPTGEEKTLVGQMPDGNLLFVGTEGIFEFNPGNLKMIRMNKSQVLDGLENLFITKRGEIFVLTGKKGIIYYYSSFDVKPVIYQNKQTTGVYQMIEYQGKILGGSSWGLIQFYGGTFKPFLQLGKTIWSLCEDENRLWMGEENGLTYFENGELTTVPFSGNHLVIKNIVPAKNRNHFWIGTNTGLIYFNKETMKMEFQVDSKEGLSGDEITSNGLFLDDNGLLWIGTYHGVSNFNIKATKEDEYSPRCYLEKVIVNGKEIDKTPNRKFQYNENNIEFEVSGLFYSDEKTIKYEYYLRGLKRDYNYIREEKDHRSYFNNVPPGKYAFVYRAKGKDDIWSYTQSFPFEIKTPFWQTWWFRILAVLVVLFLINLIYNLRVRRIQKQKVILEQQVKERTIDLEKANEEIQAQRDLATGQRDQIAAQKKEITDSIHYAERIQRSLLPSSARIKSRVADYFVLFKPRDIVSGDFFWSTEVGYHTIFVAADCTGHGVPGAFMSMLGISFLNEIVNKNHVLKADEILNQLRNHVIEALQQKGKEGEAKDGMDIAICVINEESKMLQFAGANNPLYFIRNKELETIKGDKMPVAIHLRMPPFTLHEFKIKKGDTFFLFSDGFADQFGGDLGKKFKYKPFKELLLNIHLKPMEEQEKILEKKFNNWKGDNEQIDDVVILGFRI